MLSEKRMEEIEHLVKEYNLKQDEGVEYPVGSDHLGLMVNFFLTERRLGMTKKIKASEELKKAAREIGVSLKDLCQWYEQ